MSISNNKNIEDNYTYRFTIFTPTFNRGGIIKNLYDSLCKQTFKNFEWIVIDDGSTDNTEQFFKKILLDKKINITYLKTINGGKHRAINKGTDLAKGQLFYIVDSDDVLPNDALDLIDQIEKTIPNDKKNEFAGVCGLKQKFSGDIVGNTFADTEFLDITHLQRKKYNISGDKSEVFYTSVLKRYKFPEFDNETFITESIVWDKIAYDGFKLRYFNKVTYLCDYRKDGLSYNSKKMFKSNPKGYGLFVYQSIKYKKYTLKGKYGSIFSYYSLFKGELTKNQFCENLHLSKFNLLIVIFVCNFNKKIKFLLKRK